MRALDLFCCAGGTSTGLALLGFEVVGIDYDADPCATHAAAGHPTIRADLTDGLPVVGSFDFVWASPPCTAFSTAGKGKGRALAEHLIADLAAERLTGDGWQGVDPAVWLILPTMRALLDLAPPAIGMENVAPTRPVMEAAAELLRRHGYHAEVGVLSAERYGVAQTRKRCFLIANRERPVAMPEPTHQGYNARGDSRYVGEGAPWVSMAEALGWGTPERPYYTIATSRTSGGPDAYLVGASSTRRDLDDLAERPSWQPPTAFDPRNSAAARRVPRPTDHPAPTMLSEALAKGVPVWQVSMAEALGWRVGFPRRDDQGGDGYRERDLRDAAEPAFAVTEKARSWQAFPTAFDRRAGRTVDGERVMVRPVGVDDPAPTLTTAMLGKGVGVWAFDRPSTTIVSSFRPDVVAAPGWRKAGDGPRQNAAGSVRIEVDEAARLQAFPNGHPWQGTRTSVFRQIGNAVPPPLAAAVAGAALGIDWREPVAKYLCELYAMPTSRALAALAALAEADAAPSVDPVAGLQTWLDAVDAWLASDQ